MKTQTEETSAIAITAQAKIDDVKKSPAFKFAVFMTSAAVGYFSTYWVITGLRLLPSLTGASHDNGSSAMDILRTLHSGFGG
jgi:hypothetical protein